MRTRALVLVLAGCSVVGSALIANCQSWQQITNAPPVSVGAMLLLTDGRILVHEEPNCGGTGCLGNDYTAWYTLTPDNTGSYINGTWTQVASLPSAYEPLFFGSAVLPDGTVVIQGGEYECPGGSCAEAWQSLGAWYNPVTNTWTATTPPIPNSDQASGDVESVVLPNGTWMVADCCAYIGGWSPFPLYNMFDESTLSFTTNTTGNGKADEFDEEGWTLLPNGKVLTVDAYVGSWTAANCAGGGCNSELYNPATNLWSTAGSTKVQLWDSNCSGSSSAASYEVGPGVLMPSGMVFYTGASDCQAGNTATYNSSTGVWTAQSTFPNSDAANDAPASVEVNGNVVVMASPFTGTFSTPSNFYEWNGSTLSAFPNPTNAPDEASYQGHLLVLPTGQLLFTDFTTTVEVLTSAGTFNSAWQPTITTAPSTVATGATYSISGTQFNGLTQGAAYGDDFQDATNYPLVRIVNKATSHVFYCKTHGHSTMGVATGAAIVSTNFDVPHGIEPGPSELFVVANGIASAGIAVTVTVPPTTTALTSSQNPSDLGQSVTFTATVTPAGPPTPTGTVSFTSNGATISGCSAVTLSSSRTALCTTATLAAGSDAIVAAYSGDSNYMGSSGTLTQVVKNTRLSTTTVTSNLNPSISGQSVTLTAMMMPAGPPTPTGTVGFTSNGTAITGCSAVTLSSSQTAACVTAALPIGTDAIVASYSGDTNYASSSGMLTQLVNPLQTPVQFVSVTPCRVVDTRNPDGPFGGPELSTGQTRSFAIPSGPCTGIPATAAAYSLNVTVVPPGPLGYLTIWPTSEGQPTVSTLNSLDGRIKANAAIVPAGPAGAVSVYVNNTTNVVLDIDGYFTSGSSSGLEFYPLAPCRVADTRKTSGYASGLGSPSLVADTERDFPILGASGNAVPCDIPLTAAAYSLNFTAVPPSGSALGYLTVWPKGQPRPVVSTLNDLTGTIVANAAVVPAGTGGGVAVYPNNNTDVVIDINGYFAAPASGGLSLYALTPCRVLDTRKTTGGFSGELTVSVAGSSCAPPSGAKAYIFNATAVPTGALGYLTLWPNGETQPVVSTLNALDGAITSNMAIVPNQDGEVDSYASGTTQLVMDISAYFAP